MAAVDERKHQVVAVALGATSIALAGAGALYRGFERLPLVGSWVHRCVDELSERGDRWIAQNSDPIKTRVLPVAVQLIELVLDEIDLTELVQERVDIDGVIAEIDIDAVIDRIDLIALADKVIEGVDLPAIIRESTNSVTAEVMTDVRSQGERADDLVAGIVNRVLGRDRDQL